MDRDGATGVGRVGWRHALGDGCEDRWRDKCQAMDGESGIALNVCGGQNLERCIKRRPRNVGASII